MNYIHRLAENRIKKEYSNSGPERAAIVFNELFSNSNNIFRLYAGSLSGEISSKILYTSGLRQFLQKKQTKLKILLEEITHFSENKNPILFSLLKNHKEKVVIKHSKVSPIDREGNEIHFSVGDDSMYRVEIGRTNFKARGSFNNKNEAKDLNELFDKIFDSEENSSPTNLLS